VPQSNNCQVSSVTNLLFLHVTNAGKFPNECELFAPLLNRARVIPEDRQSQQHFWAKKK